MTFTSFSYLIALLEKISVWNGLLWFDMWCDMLLLYTKIQGFVSFFLLFLLDIFFIYISNFKCYHKSSLYPPLALLPYPPTPTSWPWNSPVMGHIKFARLKGLSSQWGPTRPSSATYAARDTSSGVLISSYCCSTYRVADPFSSLGTFSSSSIGGPIPISLIS